MPSAQSALVESQLRLARTALEEGLRSSTDVRAETLLARFPVVANDTEAALELVYTEFAARETLGQKPDPAEWFARFPQWQTDLEQMFEVHRELKKEAKRQTQSQAESNFHQYSMPASAAGMIGEFEVLGEVGRGGMGVVYKARQASLGRVVAVKVILAGMHAGGRERERFRREAETAARLDHPNIVRIFAVGEHDGRAYCAMEFVDGASLADLLDGSPWPVRKAAELVATVATAAHHAHENGVVHRDLKPANILIAGTRKPGLAHPTQPDHPPTPKSSVGTMATIKIVDFGLAKSLLDTDPGPTRTGDIIGTPAYMAPEQAGPTTPIGPATDVWGIGVTLYELLVGHPPFQGATTVETLEQVRNTEPVPPRRLRPTLPRDLEVICLKCLRKDARHRYPTAAALADDLNRFLRGESILARPASAVEHVTRWCRRNPVVAGLTTAAVILATAAVVFGVAAVVNLDSARRSANELANQQKAAAEKQSELRKADLRRAVKLQVNEGVRLLNEGDVAGGAVLLADAMTNDPDPENEEIHRIRLGTALRSMPTLRQVFRIPLKQNIYMTPGLKGTDHPYQPDESDRLLSDDFSTLLTLPDEPPSVLWDLNTGISRSFTLDDADGATLVALSSNGAAVVGLRNGVTLVWDTATGRRLPIPVPSGFGTLPFPFTPDGKRRVGDGGKPHLRQLYADDGKPVGKPLAHTGSIQTAVMSADGKVVATITRDSGTMVWNAITGEPMSRLINSGKSNIAVAVSSPLSENEDRTVTTCGVGVYQTWDMKTGKLLGQQPQLVTNGLAPQYVPGHPYIATGGWDFGLRVWDNKFSRGLSAPMTDTYSLVNFSFRPNGDAAVVVDRHWYDRLWEPLGGRPLTPKLYSGERHRAQFSADGTRLTSITGSGDVRVWDAPPLLPPELPTHPWLLHSADWMPGEKEILSAGDGGAILSSAADGRVVRKFPHSKCSGMAVRKGENGLVATFDPVSGVKVWSISTGQEIETAIRPPSTVLAITFTPDGLLATGGSDGVVRFWNPTTGATTGAPLAHNGAVRSFSLSPDGTRAIVHTVGRLTYLWDVSARKTLRIFNTPLFVPAPMLTPDGSHLVLSTRTTVSLVKASDGETQVSSLALGGHGQITFSPDGRYLVSPSEEANSVTVWDVASGRSVGRPLSHPPSRSPRNSPRIAFSANGRFLAMSLDSFVMVWELETGIQVTPPISLKHANEMRFDSTYRRLLVVSADKSVRVIDLSPDMRPVGELSEFAQLLANRTLDANGELIPLDHDQARRLWEKFRPSTKH